MVKYSRDLFLRCLDVWKQYPHQLEALAPEDKNAFLNEQGYASAHDLLAHVAAWWDEADGIVRDRVEGRERPARKYDLDDFNAATLARFRQTSESDLLTWYESQRQRIEATVSGLSDQWLKVRTVYGWLDGVILEHLKEHGLEAPRFLLIGTLEREWGGYPSRFESLKPEQQADFLAKQGYARFSDVRAHIIVWWETGIRLIGSGGGEDPCKTEDVDAFNAAAVGRFARHDQSEVSRAFERTRLVLLNLVKTAADEILSKPNVAGWLRADVIEHYHEHRL